MTAHSCQSTQQLHNFAVGLCDSATMDSIAAHLEKCEACNERLSKLESGVDFLKRLRQDGPTHSDGAGQIEATPQQLSCPQCETRVNVSDSTHGEIPCPKCGKPIAIATNTSATDLDSLAALIESKTGYTILEEIGRGGMGVVFRAQDPQFERSIAVKTMLPRSMGNLRARIRFQDEAKLTGQLQHPGIPPAYELGSLGNGSPYFAMKLIEGRTLAELLSEKRAGSDALPLKTFTQICHTVGYAHSCGVIHRDLKPSNIMVGDHGEVQVMDWGLAKVIAELKDFPLTDVKPGESIEADFAKSRTGDVFGTPAYMAPEQARGEIRELDSACDVFGLGGILCHFLTGAPPFTGDNLVDVFKQAASGDLSGAFSRLDACGADIELIAICKQCLAPNKNDRPQNGAEVAELLEAHEAALKTRLQSAQIAKGQAEVRTVEETKRRKLTMLTALALILLVGGIAAGAFYYQQIRVARLTEQSIREASIDQALNEAEGLTDQLNKRLKAPQGCFEMCNTPREWLSDIEAAQSKWRRAADLAKERSIPTELSERIKSVGGNIKNAILNRDVALRYDSFRDETPGGDNGFVTPEDTDRGFNVHQQFERAFRRLGIDIFNDSIDAATSKINDSVLRELLIAMLDEWALQTYHIPPTEGFDPIAVRNRLLKLARTLDPDSWKDQLRDPKNWHDAEAISRLRDEWVDDELKVDRPNLTPQNYRLMAALLFRNNLENQSWLRRAQREHLNDFWLAYNRATAEEMNGNTQTAIPLYQAALAIRPESLSCLDQLSGLLREINDYDGSIYLQQRAVSLDPENTTLLSNLARTFGDVERYSEALELQKEVVRLEPENNWEWLQLGDTYSYLKQFPKAVESYEEAIRVAEKNKQNPEYLASSLDEDIDTARSNIADALAQMGDRKGALAIDEQRIEKDKNNVDLYNQKAFRHRTFNQWKEAAEAFRKVVELRPNDPDSLSWLGDAYRRNGDEAEAIQTHKSLYELNGDPYEYGITLRTFGRYDEAISLLNDSLKNLPPDYPHRDALNDELERTKQTRDFAKELPSILNNNDLPAIDMILAAQDCVSLLENHADAVHLYRAAFKKEPSQEGGTWALGAAYAALNWSIQKSVGEPLTEDFKAELRNDAHRWMMLQIDFLTDVRGNTGGSEVRQAIEYWRDDPELAMVRDKGELAKLPENEQVKWRQFWAKLDELYEMAGPAVE